jgi:hypothetical protein
MIFKNLVLQALGTIWFLFLQEKYFKKFHACVPLKQCAGRCTVRTLVGYLQLTFFTHCIGGNLETVFLNF